MPAECPNCRRRIPFRQTFIKTAWSRWECEGCGSLLGLNVKRRLGLGLLGGAFPFMVFVVLQRLGLGLHYVLPTVILVFALVFYFLDSVVVIERSGMRCRHCGYDLQGQEEARCPECGKEFDAAEAALASHKPHRARRSRLVGALVIGIMIALLASTIFGVYLARNAQRRARATALSGAATPVDAAQSETDRLAEQMERIHIAARAYVRDYGQWPDGVASMIGRSLPRGFTMSSKLTYRSVPEGQASAATWVLIVSEPLEYNRAGQRLDQPHRLIVRLDGRVELLPVDRARTLLASEEARKPAPGEAQPTTANEDRSGDQP